MFSPTPWQFESVGWCNKVGKTYGNIIGSDGRVVAESVYSDDAEAIMKAVNPPTAAMVRSEKVTGRSEE
jgi:hypothetical protein